MYAHLSHAFGLNDACGAMGMHAGKVWRILEAAPPCRNTFSHANAVRDSAMAAALDWKLRAECARRANPFILGRPREGFLRRPKKPIFAMDATTIALVANCMPWAKHCRKRAADKCHLSRNLQNRLPQTAEKHPEPMRRIRAIVTIAGKDREMTFLTTNWAGAPGPWLSSTAAGGTSRSSSRNSSKPSRFPTSSAIAITPSNGSSGTD